MIKALSILILSAAFAVPSNAQGKFRGPAPVERLRRLPPAQRQKLLERLPPERRQRMERQLHELDQMSPQERQRLHDRYEMFRQLPPEKQDALRGAFKHFNGLPLDRREAIRKEMADLKNMKPAERRDRIQSDAFNERYSLEEQQVMRRFFRVLQDKNPPLDLP